MRVLILGGTGVISTGITRQLLDRGDEITLFNRGRGDNPFAGRLTTVVGSRQSRDDLAAVAARNFDAVIDMIGFTELDGTVAIEAFSKHVPHYVFCSTVDVFTTPAEVYPITESHPRRPSPAFPYAYRKAILETMFERAAGQGAFELTILRPAATYAANIVAPIGNTALYLEVLKTGRPVIMHGDGSALWVATHRDDVAQGFVASLTTPRARGRSYNLQSTEFLTWERYWQIAAEAIGATPPAFIHIPTDRLVAMAPAMAEWCNVNFQFHNVISHDAAREDLGFDPKIRWAEGARALRGLSLEADPALLEKYDAIVAAWGKAMATLPQLESRS